MGSDGIAEPDWDLEQLEVILEDRASWQLVIAGPGAGKSAVACRRVADLVDEGVPASRILVVSFTRTAVAELRDRIVSYSTAGDRARGVRISTIDSHAWSLRVGFDDEPLPNLMRDGDYDLSIQRTVELFRSRDPLLLDFMGLIEHLIIDEAQDVVGLRVELVVEMLRSLSHTCGVTIFADPVQAIYGFTTDHKDVNESGVSLLERLPADCPRPFLKRDLKNNHRVKDDTLLDLFVRTRTEIELSEQSQGYLARVQKTIRDMSRQDFSVKSFDSLVDFLDRPFDGSMLVLFRRRAEALVASSYCSAARVKHRLRMSGLPIVVRPWLGWLLGETVKAILSREEFDELWEYRASVCSTPFLGEDREACWGLLHRLAAGSRSQSVDLVHLRNVVARSRPPVELCYPELGSAGPILGTIHASKGREADTVFLMIPLYTNGENAVEDSTDTAAIFEEGRVYYVGVTRARKMLVTAGKSPTRVGYLRSSRIYRRLGETKAQFEVGRDGDIDKLAHLGWSNTLGIQHILAAHADQPVQVEALAVPEEGYSLRLTLEHEGPDGGTRVSDIGQMSAAFQGELRELWSKIDTGGCLKPATAIEHLYLIAVGTVGLDEHERGAVRTPFSQSALALAPVVKGFPMIQFFSRRRSRYSR